MCRGLPPHLQRAQPWLAGPHIEREVTSAIEWPMQFCTPLEEWKEEAQLGRVTLCVSFLMVWLALGELKLTLRLGREVVVGLAPS